LRNADLIIIDWPYTSLLEAAKTALPIICYKKLWPLRDGVEDLIRKRCHLTEDMDELKRLLNKYVEGNLTALDNDELLSLYGNAGNDGKSCQRAVEFLKNATSSHSYLHS